MPKFTVYMTLAVPIDDAEDADDAQEQAEELVEDNGAEDYVEEVRAVPRTT